MRSTGLSAANLSACVSGDATRSELRHCVTTLLDASVRTAGAHDVDVLIDCVLGIDEARVLPGLHRAPIAMLRAYDRENTHLLRPPAESYTPYAEVLRLLALVPEDGTLLDCGAGNGRVHVVAACRRPDVSVYGFEVVSERCVLARQALARLGEARGAVLLQTLGRKRQRPLPPADVVYIFNSFAPKTLANVLGQLRALAARQPYTLVMKAMAESLDEVVSDALGRSKRVVATATPPGYRPGHQRVRRGDFTVALSNSNRVASVGTPRRGRARRARRRPRRPCWSRRPS